MEFQRIRSQSESATENLKPSGTEKEKNKSERVVVCAVDASPHSKNAFKCESKIFFFSSCKFDYFLKMQKERYLRTSMMKKNFKNKILIHLMH